MVRIGAHAWRAAAVAVVAACTAAGAQPRDSRIRRVEPGLGDVGGGASGRADMRRDLRRSNDFESVYEYRTGERAGSRRDGFYFRIGGGVTAVFPRSAYRMTPSGPVAAIPPGTVFYLGSLPPDLLEAPTPAPKSFNYLDLSAGEPERHAPPAGGPAAEPHAGNGSGAGGWSVFDEPYRRRRVAELLRRAAGLEQNPAAE